MSNPIFPEGFGSGTGVSAAHTELLQKIQEEIDRLDARIDGVGGGGGIPSGILELTLTADHALTEGEINSNGIIIVETSIVAVAGELISGAAGPFDLSGGKTYLRIEDDVTGATEHDLSTAISWPPSNVSAVTDSELTSYLTETFGSIPGYDTGWPELDPGKVGLRDLGGQIGYSQIRAQPAVGGGDANDSIQFPETWQVSILEPKIKFPLMASAPTDRRRYLVIKRASKAVTIAQHDGNTLNDGVAGAQYGGVVYILIWDHEDTRWAIS